MKKVASVLLLLPLMAAAAVPYWGGGVAREQYEQLLEAARREAQGRIEISSSYDRGWLESSVRLVVSVAGAGGTRQLVLAQTITHGPFRVSDLLAGRFRDPILAIIETEYTPEQESSPRLRAALGDQPLVRIVTTIYPDGGSMSELVSPEVQDQGLGLVWRGATGTLGLEPDVERVWGSFEAPGLRLVSAGHDVRVGTLRAEFESRMSAHGVPLGELSFSLDTLEVMDGTNGTPRIAFQKWLLTQTSEEDVSGMFRTNIVLRFADLARRDEHYGPGELELVMRNVDARAIGQLRERQLELKESNLPPEQRQMAIASAVAEAVRALLSSSPELELTHVNVRSQNGNLTAKAKIGVDGKNLPSFADPTFLKRVVEGSAEFRVPARIAHWILDAALSSKLPAASQGAGKEADSAMRQVQRATLRTRLLEHLRSANVLTREGDVFGLHLVYQDAELLLNGQPFDRRALSGFALTTGSSL